jgi:AraC-like DNA-binding protein
MVKPFSVKELLTRIENIIKIRQAVQARFRQMALLPPEKVISQSPDEGFLQMVTKTIRENIEDENFNIDLLLKKTGLSRTQFYRKFTALTDLTPATFIKQLWLQHAKELLENSTDRISEVAWKVGFKNTSHFTRAFKEQFGVKPSEVAV